MAVQAQVSHGGRPLPFVESPLRSGEKLFVEMPPFDEGEALRKDRLEERALRGVYPFAYKFRTDLSPENAGITFTLADGTRVWRLGIRSRGARSINLQFTEYELPEGASLYLYNKEQTHVLGAFNHLNNSECHQLPTAPVSGEEVIVEYQEPAQAAFHGRLRIGAVNHGYRALRGGVEPADPEEQENTFACLPELGCYRAETDRYDEVGRSVVLLIIDGKWMGTGVLVNNTEGDGRPYLMTASHCLNGNFTVVNPDYEAMAASIVCFFNYESPFCSRPIRGTEEMSVASARVCAINTDYDLALLELLETPPSYYRPYYAGWNVGDWGIAPYTCIQHPMANTKRVAITEGALKLSTFSSIPQFTKNAHLFVDTWQVGCTAGGSSGAPLFDADNRVVGLLSGGASTCADPHKDFFYSLRQAWSANETPAAQLQHWLAPTAAQDSGQVRCGGLDPYAGAPCLRLSNIGESGQLETAESALWPDKEGEPLFGNNSLEAKEYAEAYHVKGSARLYGAYFVTPPAGKSFRDSLEVEIRVYEGTEQPERLLYQTLFQPAYRNYSVLGEGFQETTKSLNRAQESFVRFPDTLVVSGNFYISYCIKRAQGGCHFSVYNLPKGKATRNSTWVFADGQWLAATAYVPAAFATSLFIDPVISYAIPTATLPLPVTSTASLVQGADRQSFSLLLPPGTAEARFALYTLSGKLLYVCQTRGEQATVRTGRYPAGIYVAEITFSNGSLRRKVFF